MAPKTNIIIGWEEWCALPDLDLPAVKAKIDTGAKTSALHAYDIELFSQNAQDFVRFKIHPLQKNNKLERLCTAPLQDYRYVMSSNGEREKRYVILTHLLIAGRNIEAELTLTSRHNLAFRMLLGREALRKGKFIVNPAKSHLLGKQTDISKLYYTNNHKE